jgi:hypothetical protein
MVINTSGNVGIGTTTPTNPLQVAGNMGIRQNRLYISGGDTTNNPWQSISYNAYHNASNNAWVFPDPTKPAMTIEMDNAGSGSTPSRFSIFSTTQSSTTNWISRFYINGDTGNVGIGTATPGANLEIDSNVTGGYVTPLHVFAPSLSTTNYVQMRLGVAASPYNSDEIRFYYAGNASTSNRLDLGLYGTTGLSILGNGNVGIGTTAPSYTLDVNGTIRAQSGLIIPAVTSDPSSPVTGQIWLRTDI